MADMPPSIGVLSRDILIELSRHPEGLSTGEIGLALFGSPTLAQRKRISQSAHGFCRKGWCKSIERRFCLTGVGKKIVANLDNIRLRDDHQVKTKKKPLAEIEPLPKTFTPNLSMDAASLAEGIGSVLDQNQQYRDFIKQTRDTFNSFLGDISISKQEFEEWQQFKK